MKKMILSLIACACLALQSYGQTNWPDCSHLFVSNYEMDNDTSNLMKITITNTCSNCNSGIDGPVYCELRVIQTLPMPDTIAASACFCLMTPDNNSSVVYSINAEQTSFPPEGNFYIQLAGACDSLAFNPTAGIHHEILPALTVYPNPAADQITIGYDIQPGKKIIITDITGHIIQYKTHLPSGQPIDISDLTPGIYLIRIEGINHTPARFIKQ